MHYECTWAKVKLVWSSKILKLMKCLNWSYEKENINKILIKEALNAKDNIMLTTICYR